MKYYIVFGYITHGYKIIEYITIPEYGNNKAEIIKKMDKKRITILYCAAITYKKYLSLIAYAINIKVIKNGMEYELSSLNLTDIIDLYDSLLAMKVKTKKDNTIDILYYDMTFAEFKEVYYNFYKELKNRILSSKNLDDNLTISCS
jgi:hypothetical protein